MANYKNYMLFDKLPHTWCAGCGHGIILQAIADALAIQELDKHDIALVSGIGCFGRVDDYLDINCMHVTHGRALAAATGCSSGQPRPACACYHGDGDGTTIGGNHLIHCARRNINLTVIIANNYNYGQTGGQYSGHHPRGQHHLHLDLWACGARGLISASWQKRQVLPLWPSLPPTILCRSGT